MEGYHQIFKNHRFWIKKLMFYSRPLKGPLTCLVPPNVPYDNLLIMCY
jgi:hypothetical protein